MLRVYLNLIGQKTLFKNIIFFLPKETKSMDIICAKAMFYYIKANKKNTSKDYEKSIRLFESLKTQIPYYQRTKLWYLLTANYEHFLINQNDKIFGYSDNFYNRIKRSSAFIESDKRALYNANNAIRFLIRSRYNPNLSYEKAILRINTFLENSLYKKNWIEKMFSEFSAFKFPNQSK